MGLFRASSPRPAQWAAPDLGVEPFDPPLPPVRVAVPDGEGGVTLVRAHVGDTRRGAGNAATRARRRALGSPPPRNVHTTVV